MINQSQFTKDFAEFLRSRGLAIKADSQYQLDYSVDAPREIFIGYKYELWDGEILFVDMDDVLDDAMNLLRQETKKS